MRANGLYALKLTLGIILCPAFFAAWVFIYVCEAAYASRALSKHCSGEIIDQYKRVRRMRMERVK